MSVGKLRWPHYLMLAAWLFANAGPLHWMFFALAQPTHAVQRVIMVALALLGLYDFWCKAPLQQAHPHAAIIVLAGIACASIARISTDVQVIHASAALLLLYAWSATFLDTQTWRKRLVLLLITLLCLPIQPHVDAHLGLPLRLWTAHAVAPLLQSLGVHNITVEAIIVTENGVADIASACSGVRTLWYALALWLGARLVWPQAALYRWCLAGALSAGIAIGFNALRVAALVLALYHNAPPLLADMAHTSLGLLALALVGAINLWLCRSSVVTPAQTLSVHEMRWQTHAVLTGLTALVVLLPTPVRTMEDPAHLQALVWPASLHAEPVALSKEEKELVLGYGASIAEKQHFTFEGVQGSLLVVQSNNWRAHHAPELCLLAQGAHIDNQSQAYTPQGDYRVITLHANAPHASTQTAVTWFQSGTRVVPDLGARLWAQLLHPQQAWSLVTLVVDGPVSYATVQKLHHAVHAVVTPPNRKVP